jgi:hypothetical protein
MCDLEPCSIGVDLGRTNLRIATYAQEKGLLETLNLSTRRSARRDGVIFAVSLGQGSGAKNATMTGANRRVMADA